MRFINSVRFSLILALALLWSGPAAQGCKNCPCGPPVGPDASPGAGRGQQSVGVPKTQFEAARRVPLTVRDVRAETSAHEMKLVGFSLQNNGGQDLLAFDLTFDVYAGDHAVPVIQVEKFVDYTWTRDPIPPGETAKVSAGATVSSPDPITKIVVRIQYAEFAGGERVGPHAARVSKMLNDRRRQKTETYQKMADIYRQGGTEALAQALKEPLPKSEGTQNPARTYLQSILGEKGIDGVVAELSEVLDPSAAAK